jgi:hypothetical protein
MPCPNEKYLITARRGEYPRPARFPLGPLNGLREQMPAKQMELILSRGVAVEEKMDGRHTRSAKPPFIFFSEDLLTRKALFYRVPGRYAVFDVFDMRENVFLSPEARITLLRDLRCHPKHLPERLREGLMFPVPVLASGTISSVYLPQLLISSAYAAHPETGKLIAPEGIVIKPLRAMAPGEYVSGKLLAREFPYGQGGAASRWSPGKTRLTRGLGGTSPQLKILGPPRFELRLQAPEACSLPGWLTAPDSTKSGVSFHFGIYVLKKHSVVAFSPESHPPHPFN